MNSNISDSDELISHCTSSQNNKVPKLELAYNLWDLSDSRPMKPCSSVMWQRDRFQCSSTCIDLNCHHIRSSRCYEHSCEASCTMKFRIKPHWTVFYFLHFLFHKCYLLGRSSSVVACGVHALWHIQLGGPFTSPTTVIVNKNKT